MHVLSQQICTKKQLNICKTQNMWYNWQHGQDEANCWKGSKSLPNV